MHFDAVVSYAHACWISTEVAPPLQVMILLGRTRFTLVEELLRGGFGGVSCFTETEIEGRHALPYHDYAPVWGTHMQIIVEGLA